MTNLIRNSPTLEEQKLEVRAGQETDSHGLSGGTRVRELSTSTATPEVSGSLCLPPTSRSLTPEFSHHERRRGPAVKLRWGRNPGLDHGLVYSGFTQHRAGTMQKIPTATAPGSSSLPVCRADGTHTWLGKSLRTKLPGSGWEKESNLYQKVQGPFENKFQAKLKFSPFSDEWAKYTQRRWLGGRTTKTSKKWNKKII